VKFKQILSLLLASSLMLSGADNAAIVAAIKANPALLDSPQAKAMMQKNGQVSDANSTITQAKPVNDVEFVGNISEIKPDLDESKGFKKEKQSISYDSLTNSPLRIEANDEYLQRLAQGQIVASLDKTPLKRYGIEFFSNKNGLDLASLPVPENYKLVPKDILNVVLYGPKTDNMSLTVDKDGAVVIPSFGPLHIAGLSFGQAKKTITDAMMAAYPNVGVTVNISSFSTIQVTLAGEVAVPGLYNVSSFSTIKEALIAAGGLTANGSMRSVSIKRNGRVISTIDLYTVIRGTSRDNTLLRAGDVIVVPVLGKSVIVEGAVKRPAIYEAKAATTIANLISYAGGIQAVASKNDIKITRYEANKGVKIFTVSLEQANRMIAMDQDHIMIHDLDKSNLRGVTLHGNIVKPGFWPLAKEGTSIKEFFTREISNNTLRGVFLEDTYFDYAIIKRTNTNSKEEIIGFSLSDALSGKVTTTLKNRDELYILNRSVALEKSIVKISGECISRTGEYKYFDKMTLAALLSTAGTRCPVDKTKVSIISRDPATQQRVARVVDATSSNIPLQEFDEVSFISFYTVNPDRNVTIRGEINVPGSYPIGTQDFRLNSLIKAAGGLSEKASMDKIEVIRYVVENGTRTRKVYSVDMQKAMSDDAPVLQAYDEIMIFKIPSWNEAKSVTLKGKVRFPGTYPIEDGDTLNDVLIRAGGYEKSAYVQGAVFTREDLKNRQREGMERQIKDLESRIMYIATQPTQAGEAASDKSQLVGLLGSLKEEIKKTPMTGRLSVNLDTNLSRFSGCASDILLKDGDALYVPDREDSVVVQGEVLNPNAIVYDEKLSGKEYLVKAGGLKDSADDENIFVVHANGEAQTLSGGLFSPDVVIGPGDVIVVPMYISTYSGMQMAKDITAILYQLAVSASALYTIGAI
jgi:polysaccharide biosynthesis/export protein